MREYRGKLRRRSRAERVPPRTQAIRAGEVLRFAHVGRQAMRANMRTRLTSMHSAVVALVLTSALFAGCDREKANPTAQPASDHSPKATSRSDAKAKLL